MIKNKSVLLWYLNSISSELFKLIVYCIDHQQDRLVSLLQTKNSSLWFVHPCFALSEKSPELQQSYLWIQKLMNAMRSFLHFHFISAVHIWFISYIINTHFFHGNIWTHNWPATNVSGFIAQLVEHRTSIARSRVQTRWSSEFFSGFFTQLHKLRSLLRSFLHFQVSFCTKKKFQYDLMSKKWK